MEYTDIEVLVFENEDGSEQEMNIVDEFDHDEQRYVALVNADIADGDEITVYRVLPDDAYEEVEDASLLDILLDIVEQRLLADA